MTPGADGAAGKPKAPAGWSPSAKIGHPSQPSPHTSTRWPHRSWGFSFSTLFAPPAPPHCSEPAVFVAPLGSRSPLQRMAARFGSPSIPIHLLTKPKENRTLLAWPLVPYFCLSQVGVAWHSRVKWSHKEFLFPLYQTPYFLVSLNIKKLLCQLQCFTACSSHAK